MKNRSINQGGVFSDSQRKQIDRVAKTIFQHYQKGWQPVYKKLTSQLTQANIPQQFWSLPDLNQLSAQGGYPMEGQPQGATPSPQPATQDQEAIQWARQNPNDPRAAQILKINGIQ